MIQRLLLALCVCAAVGGNATAEQQPEYSGVSTVDLGWLAVNRYPKAKIAVDDQVTDGCWLTAQQARSTVELEAIRAGYELSDEDTGIKVLVSAMGYATSKYNCSVVAMVDVYIFDAKEWNTGDYRILSLSDRKIWNDTYLLTGPKRGMSARVNDQLVASFREFLVEREHAKNNVRDQILKQAPETHGEHWRAFFAE